MFSFQSFYIFTSSRNKIPHFLLQPFKAANDSLKIPSKRGDPFTPRDPVSYPTEWDTHLRPKKTLKAKIIKSFNLLYVPLALKIRNSMFCQQCIYVF